MRGAPGPSPDRLSETVFSADSVVVRRRDQPPGGRAAGTLAEFGKAAGGASRHAAQVLSRAQLPLPGTPGETHRRHPRSRTCYQRTAVLEAGAMETRRLLALL